jgi:hypothetical protein
MSTTVHKTKEGRAFFSPSINIIRDVDTDINYLPTANGKHAYNQIINDYQIGVKSFSIVGAYGIGKSAFLWALEKSFNKQQNYFGNLNGDLARLKEFEFIRIVGEYCSLKEALAKTFQLGTKRVTTQDIISQIEFYYNSLFQSKKGLVIIIDEFGKFLEYAAKNNPESELYFIQELAEFINSPKRNIVLITTLHQDFNGYSRTLSSTQQKEWDKVKGRLKEITFNEPVEQLLLLASERISQLQLGKKDKYFTKLFKCIESAKVFPLKDYFSESIAEKLLPFDILSAAVLTLSLQKYGQNERSLFSFLGLSDPFGLKDRKEDYYNIASLYDYLINNFYSFLTTKFNPHYTHWAAIRSAIERAEDLLDERAINAIKIVKTIGLLNIFASASARLNKEFLIDYAKIALQIDKPDRIIAELEGFKIIRFVKHSNKYVLFEGTDLDIELAIDEAGNLIEKVTNVVHHLNKHFDFPYLTAKAAYYKNGSPRFFAFHLSDAPELLTPVGEIDGYINLIFSDSISEANVKTFSAAAGNATLFGLYKNTDDIRNQIFEIEKIEKVKENNVHDRVAIRELDNILQHHLALLNHFVLKNIYSGQSAIVWYFNGKRERITSQKAFNQILSRICFTIYDSTPIYKNEMVNKSRLSGAIASAKKNYLRHLTDNWSEPDFGFIENKFPPEKTIYLSLLRQTGIHSKAKEGMILRRPNDISFQPLWDKCHDFLESTKDAKRNLQDLVDELLLPPFKIKKGLLDFWLPTFLFCVRDDFALFNKDGYIPFLTDGTLDLVSKDPSDYEIKAFDLGGVRLNVFNRYRSLLNQSEEKRPTSKTFIDTIRPFLTFYKELPQFAKQTKKISKKAQGLRAAIAFSKDPEETFFNEFPKALGYNILQLQKDNTQLEEYSTTLQQAIKEIRTSYDNLLIDFESYLQKLVLGNKDKFPAYKTAIQKRYQGIKTYLLTDNQKIFLQRINSELDDRKAWLNSIAQACIGKLLNNINDEEIPLLYEKFNDFLKEFDNLCELSEDSIDVNNELAIKLEVTSLIKGLQKNLIRLPKTRNKEYLQLQSSIKSKLTDDKQLNIATLALLLEELIRDDR